MLQASFHTRMCTNILKRSNIFGVPNGLFLLMYRTSVLKPVETPEEFYHNNHNLPVFSHQSSRFNTQEMLSILLDPNLKECIICKTQPVNVEHNSTFIVDLSLLGSPKDIYVDDMGSWKYNGVYRTWVTIESDGYMTIHGNLKPSESQVKEEGTLYHLEKKYFAHKTSTDLKKTVALISGIDIHVHDCYYIHIYICSHSLDETRINLVCVVLRKPNFVCHTYL